MAPALISRWARWTHGEGSVHVMFICFQKLKSNDKDKYKDNDNDIDIYVYLEKDIKKQS